MRRLRFIPEGGALVEVTCRTLQSRFLLRPNPAVNDLVVGVLGRAQRKYPIRVCAYAFASNHFHLILDVDDALQLARFMRHVNSNLARKIGRLVGWREKFWSRRYQAIVISSEAVVQTERLKYVLAHGIKEGLVEKVTDWPGVHCAQALLTGETVQGYWFDETRRTLPAAGEKNSTQCALRRSRPSRSLPCPAGNISRKRNGASSSPT